MKTINVDGLAFSFTEVWLVEKYDDWQFYRKPFQRVRSGVKAVDILALSPGKVLFLVEVKDYRINRRTKPSDIGDEVSCKVFDTLAALLPAKLQAFAASEKFFASGALGAIKLNIVLHLEQPANRSKLFPRAMDPASVQTKLRQTLKAIDPHPKVTWMARGDMPWKVDSP